MPRAFLVVMDSVGIGGAPDAHAFYNGSIPDTGANTVAHIAEKCARGLASVDRYGPLWVPNLDSLGLGRTIQMAGSDCAPGLGGEPIGKWGAATEVSMGKDTPSGHWELAGQPVPWRWHHFSDHDDSFPEDIKARACALAGTEGILGNCHASGTTIVRDLGAQHLKTGWPICYTSADSVFQIAAHEEAFGLDRLLALCAELAPMLHDRKVGRVIARPFIGSVDMGFRRTRNRRDFAMLPPGPVLTNWVQDAGRKVHAIGKIGDIFSMQGIDDVVKGSDAQLMKHLASRLGTAEEGSLTFANFVEFDSEFGHRRDVSGYARALEWFDREIGAILEGLRAGDMLVLTADHGNDPTWPGTDHTRERVPVLIAGNGKGPLGHLEFRDVANLVADHLGIRPPAG